MRSPQRPTVRIDTTRIVTDMTAHGWNQADLSRRARVSGSTLSRFLTGDHQTAKTLAKVAKALGRSPSEYFEVTPAQASTQEAVAL